ncbi:MAG: Gfo/Idh/MocA family oxidoreductase [Candidatus Latescibacterota bacterium]|nr:Gfo/Idh/MocA family oxidoreductase [Candidatus Latescibacterota bacterium]
MSLRIGIVGAGANTKTRHIPGFQAIDGVEVVAVCNRSRESGQKAAEEFGIATVYDHYKELVNADDVDAVCVGTWPYMHCEISIATLEAGKHILTEARMAMNLEEAREMQAAVRSDKVAMIVPAPFYLETEPRLLQMVKAGFFGDWLEVHVNALGGAYAPDALLHWRQRRNFSGQNIMTMGILNETVRRYAGHDRAVIASATTFTKERVEEESGSKRAVDVPESLGVVSELEGGGTSVYHFSSVAEHGRGGVLEMHGTKATFKLEDDSAFVAENGGNFQKLEVPKKEQWGWTVENDFVDAIRDGKPVTHTNFDDGVKYMEFTEAVQVSLAEGRKVELSSL